MTNGDQLTMRTAMANIAKFVQDVGTLSVQTGYVTVGETTMHGSNRTSEELTFNTALPVAATIIRFDGDCREIIPMRVVDGQPEIDTALLELHERSVARAIEYRARILAALGELVQSRIR